MTPTQQAGLTAEVLQTVHEHFKRPRLPDDRHNIFANVLRNVPTPQWILAEKFINDVLFQAQMGTLSTSPRLTEGPQLSLPQHHEIPPFSTQSASSSSGAIPYLPACNSYHNYISTAMPQQFHEPPVYHQPTKSTRTPNLQPPVNDSTEGITALHFVPTFRDDEWWYYAIDRLHFSLFTFDFITFALIFTFTLFILPISMSQCILGML